MITTINTSIPQVVIPAFPSFSRHELGRHGEIWAFNMFKRSGYIVRDIANYVGFGADLLVVHPGTGECFNVEVKTARKSGRMFKFCLRKRGHTDVSNADYVLLICIDDYGKHYCYLLPASILTKKNLSITSHPTRYRGKVSVYRVRSQLLDFQAANDIAELAVS